MSIANFISFLYACIQDSAANSNVSRRMVEGGRSLIKFLLSIGMITNNLEDKKIIAIK